jgi:predicted metalloprotease with PDZ domain
MSYPWMSFLCVPAARLRAPLVLLSVSGFLILINAAVVQTQTLKVHIAVTSVMPARIRIDAEFPSARSVLSFRNSYAGLIGLGERIEKIEAITSDGASVPVQKLAPGEFKTTEEFAHFKYDVNVAEPARPAQMSHVSWLNREHGLLMLSDLLPFGASDSGGFSAAQITVDLPVGWTVSSNTERAGTQFLTDDPQNAVFMIGSTVREESRDRTASGLSIISSGKWPFSSKDAAKMAGKLLEQYSSATQFDLKRKAVLMLVPYPGDASPDRWSAETRGNVVVLLLGRNARAKRVLSRLGIVLSHEIFHLWVPNSLQLEGDYDWFFEGFTLYQALRMALQLRLISFDDYLETIARVYDSYSSAVDHDRLSLIEASERRWTTSSSLVYEKGMLVAFVYELSLRRLTNCRASLDDVYSELFRLSARGQRNANQLIMKLLSERPGLESFSKEYVESAGQIDLDSMVLPYGIHVVRAPAGQTSLAIGNNLDTRQRTLLSCIGYKK